MNSIELNIDGETFELTPSFAFIKRLKKVLGTGSLFQIQAAAASLDATVIADILESALRSHNINKFNNDKIGELLMKEGGIVCVVDGEDVGGIGAAIRMITMTLEAFTSEKKNETSGDTEKN